MVGGRHLLLAVLQEALQVLDALVPRNQLALGNRNLLLQCRVLLHELALHLSELLQIPLEEGHLLLLGPVVGRPQHVVVLLARLVQGNLELDDALATVLQVAHEALLHHIELGNLLLNRLPVGHWRARPGLDALLQVLNQCLHPGVLRRLLCQICLQLVDQLHLRRLSTGIGLFKAPLDLLRIGLVEVAGKELLVLLLQRLQSVFQLLPPAGVHVAGRGSVQAQLGLPDDALRL